MTIEFRPEIGENKTYPDESKIPGVKIYAMDLPSNIDTKPFSAIPAFKKGPMLIRVDVIVNPQSIGLQPSDNDEVGPQSVSNFQFEEKGLRVVVPNPDGMDLKGKFFPKSKP